jgi:hypothetical protein
VLQVCGGGVDQQVGRRVSEFPCEGLNPFCVEDEHVATCTSDPNARCTSSDEHCQGNILVTCTEADWDRPGGLFVSTDCAAGRANPVCAEDPTNGYAACAMDATTRCTTSDQYCDGPLEVLCVGGFLQKVGCPASRWCTDSGGGNVSCPG